MRKSPYSDGPAVTAPVPAMHGEDRRAMILSTHGLDALEEDPELAAIVRFAAKLCNTPTALVSLVECERQRFLARQGMTATETPRSQSFCAHAMFEAAPMVIEDATTDPRFADNPLVIGEPFIRFYAGAPLMSDEGVPLGSLCVIDSTVRPGGLDPFQLEGLQVLAQAVMRRLRSQRLSVAAHEAMEKRGSDLRIFIDGLPHIAFAIDKTGRCRKYNARFAQFTGTEPPVTMDGWRAIIHPDDHAPLFADWHVAYEAALPFEGQFRLRRTDGEWRWMAMHAVPVDIDAGGTLRWFNTVTDIHDSHRESEGRDLLARELSHRIKNIFAVVAGLVSLSTRRRPELKEFGEELIGTIRALGRAHDFVRPLDGDKGDSMVGLLTELFAPYEAADESGSRVRLLGGDCTIGHRAATPLALVFHELATNSAKYGALSAEGGHVELDIDCAGDHAELVWREIGGPPPVSEPAEGFGSRLVEMAVGGQLNGTMAKEWSDSGLVVTLNLPTESIRN